MRPLAKASTLLEDAEEVGEDARPLAKAKTLSEEDAAAPSAKARELVSEVLEEFEGKVEVDSVEDVKEAVTVVPEALTSVPMSKVMP